MTQPHTFPKISIVVHLFNREAYLRETLDSILNQKYPNLELIVIDDASTDKGWEILETYGKAIAYKERLTGSRTSPVEALNIGFSHSTGEIMTWINTKNILFPKSLFVIAEVFSEMPEVKWLTGFGTMIDDDSRPLRVIRLYKHIYDYLRDSWEIIQQESTFWRRNLWTETGSRLEPEYPWSFDTTLWTKFFPVAKLYHVNTIIGAYRENAQSTSIRQRPVILENTMRSLRILQKNAPAKTKIEGVLYRVLRLGKPLLRNIPDSVYARIPLLNIFCYPCIQFVPRDKQWKPAHSLKNPFRVTH